jgi:hypothetical protein
MTGSPSIIDENLKSMKYLYFQYSENISKIYRKYISDLKGSCMNNMEGNVPPYESHCSPNTMAGLKDENDSVSSFKKSGEDIIFVFFL